MTDRVGPRQGDLERDHPAQRAAHDELDDIDPQRVEQPPLGSRLVARGDGRECVAVRSTHALIDRCRAGRPVPAAEQVGAEDPDAVGVERPTRAR